MRLVQKGQKRKYRERLKTRLGYRLHSTFRLMWHRAQAKIINNDLGVFARVNGGDILSRGKKEHSWEKNKCFSLNMLHVKYSLDIQVKMSSQ